MFLKKYAAAKETGITKAEFLKSVAGDDGIYVPSLYEPLYNEDGTVREYRRNCSEAPEKIRRSILEDLEHGILP